MKFMVIGTKNWCENVYVENVRRNKKKIEKWAKKWLFTFGKKNGYLLLGKKMVICSE